jgi:regulatory protein
MAVDPALYDKLIRFCAYRERCELEVRQKMKALDVHNKEPYIKELIEDDLLNEERYAKAFAQGRFRMKYWGRHKIRSHMRQKGIANRLIDEALASLDYDEYILKIKELITHKAPKVKGKNEYDRRAKIQRYLLQKGYESNLIMECMAELKLTAS